MYLARRMNTLLVALSLAAPLAAQAADITVPDSDHKVSDTRKAVIAGKSTALKLTGAGLREKAFINVYVIASYVDAGAAPHSASELSGLDAPKQMVLTMERDVDGPKMAEALSDAIRGNYPSGMDAELGQLKGFLEAQSLNDGDEVVFTWQPGGGGVICTLTGKSPVTIKSPEFAHAVWDIWLGGKPVQSDIKKNLVERL
jgi:hypothetical protein